MQVLLLRENDYYVDRQSSAMSDNDVLLLFWPLMIDFMKVVSADV